MSTFKPLCSKCWGKWPGGGGSHNFYALFVSSQEDHTSVINQMHCIEKVLPVKDQSRTSAWDCGEHWQSVLTRLGNLLRTKDCITQAESCQRLCSSSGQAQIHTVTCPKHPHPHTPVSHGTRYIHLILSHSTEASPSIFCTDCFPAKKTC